MAGLQMNIVIRLANRINAEPVQEYLRLMNNLEVIGPKGILIKIKN